MALSILVNGCSLFDTKKDEENPCLVIIKVYLPPVVSDLDYKKVKGNKDQVIVPSEFQHVLSIKGSTDDTSNNINPQINIGSSTNLSVNLKDKDTEVIYFDFNKSSMNPAEQIKINALIDRIGSKNLIHVDVEGYTDSVGTNRYNQKLSVLRAETVKKYLISIGVEGSNITARGFGENDPVELNDSPENRSKNRRSVITPFLKY